MVLETPIPPPREALGRRAPSSPTRGRCTAWHARSGWLVLLALLLLGAPLDDARAHGRSLSYSSWQLADSGAQVTVRTTLLELSRLGIPLPLAPAGPAGATATPSTDAVGRYLQSHLGMTSEGGACAPSGPPLARPANEGWSVYRWQLDCPSLEALEISTRILLAEAPSHLHFARVRVPAEAEGGSAQIRERVLTESEPSWLLGSAGSAESGGGGEMDSGSGFSDYLALGVEHILSGWDHLAFVLALILLASRLGEVARLVTGFTIAHSITLALAVLGWVHPAGAPIEAVIGFSVALVAAENGWQLAGRDARVPIAVLLLLIGMSVAALLGAGHVSALTLTGLTLFGLCHFGLLARARQKTLMRLALAFAFGLVHGFGFAGVLAEMALPAERLAPALVGFNVGVEIGQLGVVAVVWPILAMLRRTRDGWLHRRTAEWASAAVCGTGLYWFVSRTLGPG